MIQSLASFLTAEFYSPLLVKVFFEDHAKSKQFCEVSEARKKDVWNVHVLFS